MGRGFLAGIFWGGMVGLAILFLSSQIMDRRELSFPKPEAAAVEVPAGTEFDQARPESNPVVPEAETRPGADAVAGVTLPEDAVETPPAFDTSSLEVPQPSIEGPQGLGKTPEVADGVQINVRDRGHGFDPETVSSGGMAHSIVGRVTEAGGTANIKTVPGQGTDVSLFLPTT